MSRAPLQIRVGNNAPRFQATGQFLSGTHASPQEVTVTVDEDIGALTWVDGEGETHSWPFPVIREVPDQAGRDIMVLRNYYDPVQRLILPDREITPRLPNRTHRAPVTKRGRLIAWAVAALASVALIIGVLVPRMADQMALLIPTEGERALGETTLGQIRAALDETGLAPVPVCDGAPGLAALSAMTDKLTFHVDLPVELNVVVLDHDMVNAFALPGGYVVLFDGLINAARTPEELAAVMAHEIGHVVSRDPTRHALRSAGSIGVLGLLFGDFAGGAAVLFLTERLINAQYSQAAEETADIFAHELMRLAEIPPSALADMFRRFQELGGDAEGIMAHLSSHPQLRDRIQAAEATEQVQAVSTLLDPAAWNALRAICR